MTLVVKGRREKIRKLLKEVEKLGLNVLLFSEEDVDIKFLKDFEAENLIRPLRLPEHLRKTYLSLMKFEEAKAEDISSLTGRARAVESAYLNTLVNMGYVKKARKGREVHFWIENNYKLPPSLLENLLKK